MLAAALSVGIPTVAHAEDPVTFGASHIADKVGAIGDREAEVTAALDQLYTHTRSDLFVVYVANFSGVADREQWADQTAVNNGLGTNDVLLAVATNDREYQLSVDPNSTLTDAQLSDVETIAIEPALRESDWAGAAIGAAEGLAASINGEQVVAPAITPGNPTPSGGGGASVLWVALLAIVVIGAIVFFVLRRRRVSTSSTSGKGSTTGIDSVPTERLGQQASSALVQTDDAIKTSEQELGFAIAQYGAASTVAFQAALSAAKAQLIKGFTLQQKIDDVEPDTEEQERAWYTEIIDLCAQANTALDEQAADFDELRQLEKRAPEASASVAQGISSADARIAQAEADLASLGSQYTDASIATVADNPGQAQERIRFARSALAEANAKLTASARSAASVGIRASEESVDQANLLLDAVDRLGADLQRAAQSVTAAVRDLETDLITAGALPTNDDASASLPSVIAITEQVLTEARSHLVAGRINPLDLVQKLEAANTQMDAALQGVRDATAQAQRTQAALNQTLLSARSQVSAAEDFITARRGAVGAEARTRLAEAGRLVAQAESQAATDPAAGLVSAQRANSLAAQAISLARDDVRGFSDNDDFGGMLGGRGASRGSGDGTMGAILGGILINSILGGGGSHRRGGIFGGGGRRGGGGGFGGTSRSPGSFGGSGTRSRRGGGGRF